MKNALGWTALAVVGLAAVAGSETNSSRVTTRSRSVNARAAAVYRLRSLSDPDGQYDGQRYQAALAARATMLEQQRRVQLRSSLRGRAAAAVSSEINWTELGPGNVGGRINTIWIDPNSAQHIIIGAAGGGLWQSRDGGTSWTAIGEFPGSLAVGAIAQLPNGTLLVGTGDFFNQLQPGDGMFSSSDGGTTWSPIASTAPRSNNSVWSWIDSITTNSNGVALAATWGGIARSADGGNTWAFVWPGAGTATASRDVVFDPNNPSVAVADDENGAAIYSVDSGQTWTLATGLPGTQHARTALAFDSAVAGSVYALVDNNNATSPSGEVFHSTDGGKTWTLLAGTAAFVNQHSGNGNGALCDDSLGGKVECQGNYDNVIGVVPQGGGKPPLIAVGGIDIFISTNGGGTWAETGSWLPSDTNYLHADQHAFAFSASTGTAYVGNDGGLYKTPVAGGAWTPLNNGLAITQFYSVAGHAGVTAPGNKVNGLAITPILAGAQDNGMLLYEGYRPLGAPQPNNWVQAISGDGGIALVDPANGNNIYGEYVFLQPSFSTTGGPNLQGMSPSPPDNGTQAANFIAPMTLVPNGTSASTQMLAGGATLWLGNNVQTGAPTWSSVNNNTLPVGSNGNFISAIQLDPASNNNIWVGFDDGQVWYTTNATAQTGPTWVQANVGSPATKVTSFWIVPGQSTTVYATFAGLSNTNGSVFATADGGQTWSGVGAALPVGPVFSLVTHPAYAQILYAGTLTGVYLSNDGGRTWTTSTQGPGNIAVNQLSWFDVSTPNQPVLLAATDGRGAWMGSPAYQPTPTLTSLNPAQVTIGSPTLPVVLNGTGFTNSSSVTLDSAAIAATYVSSTQLQVMLASTVLSKAGAHTLVVTNPIPGGGTSAGATFTVAYPSPTITSMSPNTATAGAAGLTVDIIGAGFEPVSIVQWNGTALATTYVSATELTAMVPTANLAGAANSSVTVVTPAPGGGASAALSFTISAPSSSHGGGGALGGAELLLALGVICLRGVRARFRSSG
ncbi:MAG: hypothetical protein M3O26_21060 [Pseudomonadota bacterium]|nr:hypothetical protein [Pseudomonadota bacterium]